MSRLGVPAALPPVRVHDLTVSYHGHPAVHHLSGEFAAGALTAIVGPNGAGKSSLLSVLAGTRADFQGRLQRPPAQQVAYLPQTASIDRTVPVTVHEVVAMGLWARLGCFRALDEAGWVSVTHALAAVGLSGFEQRLIGEMSAGQAQRVLFARVLVQDAALILLDEPFNAVDARTTADLLAVLQRWRREARTVIAVLHDLDQVRDHFDQVLLLAREAVAWGPTAQVLNAEHLFKARQMAESWDDDAPVCGGRP
ncbi:ABC transporter ATP-binding protein [Schlegelella sp. S2-27]|uniref:ABC transporter ATP-binding protein n=1 Tax=Caldimonas mangrovi TaxID=2944811 RepID=A0ABT0YPI2_9BURK|nr:zinc ABC transporter ATP-binding protein AztA [Caldimonas mangrovi]MCM5680645.1 ABC transporter ATP-binding protein [Caldimonas mangrovi]